jgi:hypothetical protein
MAKKVNWDWRYILSVAFVIVGGLWAAFAYFYPFWKSHTYHICRSASKGDCDFEHDTFIGCGSFETWAAATCWSKPSYSEIGARAGGGCGTSNTLARCIPK